MTYGPEVADLCAKVDFAPDPQQELGLDLIFAIKPDGSPATFEFCVICCRQNLKTGLFKQAAIGWLFVTEQQLIVWSAHEMSTTNEAQRELGDLMLSSPHLSKHMMANKNNGIYDANGEERIELANGQRILFKARTMSGGRGLAAPKLILDEAFALKSSMMGSLLPLMVAQVDPQVLYGSSAGKADSDVLLDIRERGRKAMSPAMTYLEWLAEREKCADKDCTHPKDAVTRGIDCALDREHLIRAANPTITTGRINLQTIVNLRQALPPEEFMRECLGWWDESVQVDRPVSVGSWDSCEIEDDEVPQDPAARFALSMSAERILSIGAVVAGETPYVDLAEHSRVDDTDAVVDWLVERCKRRVVVMVDTRDPAAQFIPALRARKVKVNVTTQSDFSRASMALKAAIDNKKIAHCGQEAIEEAIKVAVKGETRDGRRWEFVPATPAADISPLRAVALAYYGLSFEKPGTQKKRKAVVMS